MLTSASLSTYQSFLNQAQLPIPDFHVVLGSGFGQALQQLPADWQFKAEISFTEIPGLVGSTVQDHKGSYQIWQNQLNQKTVQFQMGRIHGYEGHSAKTVITPVMLPRLAGVKHFILTNAAGGLLPTMIPGEAMLITDHVNLTGQNPLIGPNPQNLSQQDLGPRFPDMGGCYQPEWQDQLGHSLSQYQVKTSRGVYLGVLGPSFETHSEVKLFANWGMGAVGMSTVWEAIALKHSGAKLAGLSLISNLGAGLSNTTLDHETIVETCRLAAGNILKGITHFITQH